MSIFLYAMYRVALVVVVVVATALSSGSAISLYDLKTQCVVSRFKDPQCDPTLVMDRVESVVSKGFSFRSGAQIRLYTQALVLLNNLNYYKPYKTDRFVSMMAQESMRLAQITFNVTSEMQRQGAELFRWTVDSLSRYHSFDTNTFMRTFPLFVDFFNTFVLWDNMNMYIFGSIAFQYQHMRQRFEARYDYTATEIIDTAMLQATRIALSHPMYWVPRDMIRETVYVVYVSKLRETERRRFAGLYTVLTATEVMAPLFNHTIGNVTYSVHQSRALDEKLVPAMKKEIDDVYDRFVKFHAELNMTDYRPVPSRVDVFVHESKAQYSRYGPLWSVPTNNGGYTRIDPATMRIQMHVYHQRGTELPLNFGHEIHHTLVYATDDMDSVPLWYAEGTANAYGNRDCFQDDHAFLKQHTKTRLTDIVTADYGSNLLYPMGHVLARFLHSKERELLKRMIESRNYTLDAVALQKRFERFAMDRVEFCNYYEKTTTYKLVENTVQAQYRAELEVGAVFALICSRYIVIEFEDCFFVMTPQRLIKTTRYKTGIDVEYELANNFDTVSQYDYEWFKRGAIKHTLLRTIDALSNGTHESAEVIFDKYLMPREIYEYRSRVFCSGGGDGLRHLIEYTTRTKEFKAIPLFANGADFKRAIGGMLKTIRSCEHLVKPLTVLFDLHDVRLRAITNNISRYEPIVYWADDPGQLRIELDGERNTLMHWAALQDASMYEFSVRKFGESSSYNAKGLTPGMLYAYRLEYQRLFGYVSPYCFSYRLPSTMKPAPTTTVAPPASATDFRLIINNSTTGSTASTGGTSSTAASTGETSSTTGFVTVVVTSKPSAGQSNKFSFSNIIIYLCIIGVLLLCLFGSIISLVVLAYNKRNNNNNGPKGNYNYIRTIQ